MDNYESNQEYVLLHLFRHPALLSPLITHTLLQTMLLVPSVTAQGLNPGLSSLGPKTLSTLLKGLGSVHVFHTHVCPAPPPRPSLSR